MALSYQFSGCQIFSLRRRNALLITDTELELANAYGVYGEKKFMGKIYDGIHRMSFLIGADGLILKTYCKVKPDDHASEVLADLAALSN